MLLAVYMILEGHFAIFVTDAFRKVLTVVKIFYMFEDCDSPGHWHKNRPKILSIGSFPHMEE